MALFLLCPNLGWIQGQFNFTELSLRYPAGTGANRRDGDQPDEETDPAAYNEMGVLPVPEGAGVRGGRGGEESETGDEPERGVAKGSTIAGEGVRKILCMMEDLRNVRYCILMGDSRSSV
jgi:hypothetical protein